MPDAGAEASQAGLASVAAAVGPLLRCHPARLDVSPEAPAALFVGLGLRVDPHSATPRQPRVQSRPGCVAALGAATRRLLLEGLPARLSGFDELEVAFVHDLYPARLSFLEALAKACRKHGVRFLLTWPGVGRDEVDLFIAQAIRHTNGLQLRDLGRCRVDIFGCQLSTKFGGHGDHARQGAFKREFASLCRSHPHRRLFKQLRVVEGDFSSTDAVAGRVEHSATQ